MRSLFEAKAMWVSGRCLDISLHREVQEEKGKKLKDFEAALPGNPDIEVRFTWQIASGRSSRAI